MDATFAPRCHSHVAFLKSGSVVRMLSTHGSPDDLTMVSYEDLKWFCYNCILGQTFV